MASAPLNWLLKVGAETLNTTTKTLSGAVNELLSALNNLNTNKADKTTVSSLTTTVGTKVAKTDLLSLEEIAASTSLTNKGASAASVKELNNSLSKVKTYVGSDRKLHFIDASGADTALPFNKTQILPYFVRLNHNNYSTFGWYYIGVIVKGTKHQTNSGNYNNNFPDTFTSGTFTVDGHKVYVVASGLTANGQSKLPSSVTLKLYVDSKLFGTYKASGVGSDSTYALEGLSKFYFPSGGLIEL